MSNVNCQVSKIIGIDARFYGPETKGLGRYVERLIEYLEKVDNTNQYLIFLRKENWDQYNPANKNFKKVLADFRWYSLSEQILMPYLIWKYKIDLMHFPHFNVPLLNFKKFVVTIHDLILIQFPTPRASTLGPLMYKIKNLAYRMVISSAVKKSAKIITVSQYTESQLLKHFHVDPSKIEVTYLACDSVETGQLKIPESNLVKLGINKPYLLYVGNAYPHKNLEKLLESFKKFIKIYGDSYQLVLIGKEDYFYERIKKLANDLKLNNDNDVIKKVVFGGYVSQAMLADLYRNARLYVFPSMLEGFGLPALEAMRYELPVVCSNSSCLPEILGDAALYFDPTNIDDTIKAVYNGLTNDKLRAELVLKGKEQIKKYKWLDCAQKTLSIYNNL